MRIFGLPVGDNGCGYYRCYQPLTELRNRGHWVALPARGMVWLPDGDETPVADRPGIFMGQMVTGPKGMALWEDWAGKTALVYDIDDDVFTADHAGSLWHEIPEIRPIAAYLMSLSDLVTVSTPHLAEIMSKFSRNVVVLNNCVDERLLALERPRREQVTVGWAGATSHEKDFRWLSPILSRFLNRNPDVGFTFAGGDFSPCLKVEPGRCRHTPWQAEMWDYYAGIDFDVGIAPLTPAREFNKSKSHIKALEYAALGIPVVASDCEPYREFVEHGVTGFLARRDHEWDRYLRDLVNDEAMRTEMGAAAKKLAAGWTIQARAGDWEAAYERVVGRVPVDAERAC